MGCSHSQINVAGMPKFIDKKALAKPLNGRTWIAISGKVYDVSEFMNRHPGGMMSIFCKAGQDATLEFENEHIHSASAMKQLDSLYVGEYDPDGSKLKAFKENMMKAKAEGQPTGTGVEQMPLLQTNNAHVQAPPIKDCASQKRSEEDEKKSELAWQESEIERLVEDFALLMKRVEGKEQDKEAKEKSELPLVSVSRSPSPSTTTTTTTTTADKDDATTDKEQDKDLHVVCVHEQVYLSYNTKLIKLKLRDDQKHLMPKPGQHIRIYYPSQDGMMMSRSYTPIPNRHNQLYVLVKSYPNGSVSRFLHALREGHPVRISGPSSSGIDYEHILRGGYTHIGMIAGGTGITPMYQILTALVQDYQKHPDVPKAKLSLLYSNHTTRDCLLHAELMALCKQYPDLDVTFVFSRQKSEGHLEQSVFGRIDEALIKQQWQHHVTDPEQKSLVMVCGPPLLSQHMLKTMEGLGYDIDSDDRKLHIF